MSVYFNLIANIERDLIFFLNAKSEQFIYVRRFIPCEPYEVKPQINNTHEFRSIYLCFAVPVNLLQIRVWSEIGSLRQSDWPLGAPCGFKMEFFE